MNEMKWQTWNEAWPDLTDIFPSEPVAYRWVRGHQWFLRENGYMVKPGQSWATARFRNLRRAVEDYEQQRVAACG